MTKLREVLIYIAAGFLFLWRFAVYFLKVGKNETLFKQQNKVNKVAQKAKKIDDVISDMSDSELNSRL